MERSRYFRLDEDKQVVPCDRDEWGRAFEGDRKVARTDLGEVAISTVFVGLDMSFNGSDPLVFETLAFGGFAEGECERYATWAEAEAGHAAMVEKVAKVQRWGAETNAGLEAMTAALNA